MSKKFVTLLIIVGVILFFCLFLFVARPATKESLNLSVSPIVSQPAVISAAPQPSSYTAVSRDNNASTATNPNDPLAALRAIPQASTFVSLLRQTGVVSQLSTSGTYTFFVPTNAAFDSSPLAPLASMFAADKQRLAEFHIVPDKRMSIDSIKFGYITMLSRDQLNADVFDIAQVGGNTHIVATYPAPNGIIYLIDHVLLPPERRPFPF